MYNILIVSALSAELKEVKKEIKSLNLSDFKISYLVSEMSNYNMIYNLTRFLEQNRSFDFIINIWVCGYKQEKIDLIQVWRIKNIINNKELIVPNFLDFSSVESIISSEKIIYDKKEIWEENFVDMESFWFEFVSEKFNLPRLILKIPVDKIWEETKNFDYNKAKKYLRENIDYKKLFEKIWEFLLKNNSGDKDLEKYFQVLNLTETQKTIFERLYNKYDVLVWNNFDDYLNKFLENFKEKKLQKNDVKKFLKNLENFLEDK